MPSDLLIHPNSRCDAVLRIVAEAARPRPGVLALRYEVTGEISELILPSVRPGRRVDGLWRHSCFEAFVQTSPGPGYVELNFAPSTDWAAYGFRAYREAMSQDPAAAAPTIDVRRTDDRFILQAELLLDAEAIGGADARWRLGLSAVIEEASGRLSYWALRHRPGKPDFHHSDCFILEPAAPFSS